MWGPTGGKEDLRAAYAYASASIALPRLMGLTPAAAVSRPSCPKNTLDIAGEARYCAGDVAGER
jgi:hypothetical protein